MPIVLQGTASLDINGASGNTVTWTNVDLTLGGTGTYDADWCVVTGSTVTGGTVDATDNCTDNGGNSGWTFSSAPDDLTANDVESASEVDSPAIGQAHALSPIDLQSTSEVTEPALSTEGTDALLADDVESASQVDAPVLGQVHALAPNDVESGSEVDSPVIGGPGTDVLDPNNLQSISQVDAPVIGQVHVLTALDVSSISQVDAPVLVDLGAVTIADVYMKVLEIWKILGLDSDHPMTVTPSSRVSGDISQTFTGDGVTSTTVTRDT